MLLQVEGSESAPHYHQCFGEGLMYDQWQQKQQQLGLQQQTGSPPEERKVEEEKDGFGQEGVVVAM